MDKVEIIFGQTPAGVVAKYREVAEKSGLGRFRAPHCSASQIALVAELAIAAGGVLFLDEAEAFRASYLDAVICTWREMPERVRPVLVLRFRHPPGGRLRDTLTRRFPDAEIPEAGVVL